MSSIAHTYAPIHRPLLGITLRVLGMAFMAVLCALVKVCGERGVPVLEIAFFRNAFAFIPLGLYIWRTTGFEVLRTTRPLAHVRRSAIGLVGMTFGFLSLQRLPLTDATALQFTAPLIMTALSALLLSERVGRHRWGAVVIGFVGVMIMVRPFSGEMQVDGVIFGILGALGLAGAMVAIRQLAETERGPTIVFYFTLSGMVYGLLGSLLFGWTTPDAETLGLLALIGIVGGIGQLLLTEALRAAPVGLAAPFDYTQLIWAALLGLMIWGELPHPATIIGAVTVAASGIYILHRELRHFRTVTTAPDAA